AAAPRRLERERREDREPQAGIGGRAPIECIHDVIRLAEAERQAEHDRAADALDERIDAALDVVERARWRPPVQRSALSRPRRKTRSLRIGSSSERRIDARILDAVTLL